MPLATGASTGRKSATSMMTNFQPLQNELRITPADLDTFARQGSHAVDELPKLLTALGIDEKELSRT
jgi:hypothetical protein